MDYKTPEIIGSALAATTALLLGIRRFRVTDAKDSTAVVVQETTEDVIQLLHTEIKRMAELNSILATTVTRLQQENIELKGEISKLKQTVEILLLRSRDRRQNREDNNEK